MWISPMNLSNVLLAAIYRKHRNTPPASYVAPSLVYSRQLEGDCHPRSAEMSVRMLRRRVFLGLQCQDQGSK